MFKKTRVRQIIELLQKNLSDREISTVLGVSRNSAARIRQASDGCNAEWEELLMMTDDELYRFFYPDKFKPKQSYASVDYAYMHKELSKVGVTEVLLWEEYCEKCKKEGAKACSYPTFARGYIRYTVSKNYTSHIEHKPGVMSRPPQHRHLKRKDSIRFLVFLAFSSIQAGRKIFSASAMTVWLFIQKQLCCFRICLMLPVVFLRRQIAVCFVDTLPVIKYPYILEHCGFGFLPCPEMLPVEPFLL